MTLLFFYLAPLQNDAVLTSRCVQFTFGDKGEVYLLDESAPTRGEKREYARMKKDHRP